MSRRYPTAELYEERQRDFYRDGNRSERNYEELDIELNHSHGNPRRSAPDFLREDYGRSSNAGPLVVRAREEESVVSSRAPARRREVEQDSLVIRSGRGPPPPASSVREVEREDISIRRGVGEGDRRRPREVERDETDITIRHREQSRPRPPPTEIREVEREDITFRRGGGPPRPREVEIEREEVRFREREPPRREVEREEITFRHEHREESRHGRERDVEKESITIRGRERSLPAPRAARGELVAREHEEFIVRRRVASPSPPPPPVREVIKDQIIIRRRERSPSPAPAPLPPPPPPPPEPEIRPPIIQEIITHHRHIDHGVERARSPTPPPAPPSPPPRDEILDIQIRRRENRNGGGREYDEDIILERSTEERSRSLSAPKRRFTTADEFGPAQKSKDMWTEITKDLVLRDAIDSMGYDVEETDDFFYVMEYLKYEDVLHLVEISDEIRRKRKSRIRQIEYEREDIRRPSSGYEDRYYEHEVSFDRHRGGRYR